ncbi:MAG: trehalose 6-phosphate synthase [Candidatus Omnitrophica bacterium]|nr:trehalose 6-phosphate synthase [Candidatus Omnitrophota bacterium]
MKTIETLKQFYEHMHETKSVREKIVDCCVANKPVPSELTNALRYALGSLELVPQLGEKYYLLLDQNRTVELDLRYEVGELQKDIFFLNNDENTFYQYLGKLHRDFSRQIQEGEEQFKGFFFETFITDRDGTTNNYCGRYGSSVQSVYNAVFLTRFIRSCVDNAVMLTSAPLMDVGLLDVSVNPTGVFIYAASKGREYIDREGNRHQYPIKKEKQLQLDILNKKLSDLVQQPAYEKFSLIGSGLQRKFGQTTIARQDIAHSIAQAESDDFFTVITKIVRGIDPETKFFSIEDTGLDIEIILTIQDNNDTQCYKDFDKGDAVTFLNNNAELMMNKGTTLVCGDTKSDVPMILTSMEESKDTHVIFVTKDDNLKKEVQSVCKNSFFVSEPDILVALLNNLGKKERIIE